MAPTPWVVGYRLDLYQTTAGLVHVYQVPVEATPAGAGSYNINCKTLTSQPIDDVVDHMITKLKPVYTNETTFTGFKLYKHVSGTIFDAILDGSRSVVGTHTGVHTPAGQITVTLRDIARKFAKLVLLETGLSGSLHVPYPTSDASLDPLIADYLPAAAGALSFYEVAWSRGENAIRNPVFITLTLNRKLRRKRGLL